MKQSFIIAIAIIVIGLSACKKTDKIIDQSAIDDTAIKNYLRTNNITAIKHSSGIYYQIKAAGNGAVPTLDSTVVLNYTAQLISGKKIEDFTDGVFKLNNVIRAWQIGIPLIKPGGQVILYVPSALAYGPSSPKTEIPANAVLVFDIDFIGYRTISH